MTPENEAVYKAMIPLGRYGGKSEIADLALFLSSDAAHHISGAIITCDCGASI